jgi:hypothetical protein
MYPSFLFIYGAETQIWNSNTLYMQFQVLQDFLNFVTLLWTAQGLMPPPPPPGLVGRRLLQALPTRIDPTVIRAIPTIVAFFVSGLLSFFRKPRHMVRMNPIES